MLTVSILETMASTKQQNGARTTALVSLRVKVPASLEKYAKQSGGSVEGLLQGAVDDLAQGVAGPEYQASGIRCSVTGCSEAGGSYLLTTKFPAKHDLEGMSLIKKPFEILAPLCELHAKLFDICSDHEQTLLDSGFAVPDTSA